MNDRPLADLGAIVLAGGRSRRMGQSKAFLPFGNELLLQRVVRRLGHVASRIVVVRAPSQDLPPLPAGVVIADDPVEGRGPLQGLAIGLAALSALSVPIPIQAAFVSSTDAPFVDPALVRFLFGLLGTDHDIVVPRAQGHYHPLAAVYRLSVEPEVQKLLAEDRLRPFFLFERARTLVVAEDRLIEVPGLESPGPELLALTNLNTPDDWHAALLRCGLPVPG